MKNPDPVQSGIDWLKTPIQFAKGVGPYLSKIFGKVEIKCFEDMLYHLPFRYLDRRKISYLNSLTEGKGKCVLGEVFASGEVLLGRTRKKIYEVILTDGKGYLIAKWFRYSLPYFKRRFKKGEKFLFFGDVSLYRREKQMVHPETQEIQEFFSEEEIKNHLNLIPVYSLTEGLNQRQVRKAVGGVLTSLKDQNLESLPPEVIEKFNWPSLEESFFRIHQPQKDQDLEILSSQGSKYHKRLIFDEFFYLQLGLGIKRKNIKKEGGVLHKALFNLRNQFLSLLPFELTKSQIHAQEEIITKMCSPQPMNLLLQGDVGSGKTIVSMLASLLAIENGKQVALMVPTEILAEQHRSNFKEILEPLGIKIKNITSSTPNEERKRIVEDLNRGDPLIIVGTHALLEEDVGFENLSLVIIDEQHRFGVRQRMKLMNKGCRPDVMVMTATPIPRSLAMTLYGDLDLCVMNEMPRGRKVISTRIMIEKKRPLLYEFVRKKILEGRQSYFVFPLVEESEKLDLKDATQAFERLNKEFPEFSVGMIHGRMKGKEKEHIMNSFKSGDIQILVATTVIEVGIDVPNATLMVIEHAERFGLSQLHQLRGRVGRGPEKSYCILATGYKQSELARARLKVMEESCDGFKIAEEDLKIRGPGDFLGTRQSGLPSLRIGNLISDLDLLESAQKEAKKVLEKDPLLKAENHRSMQVILRHRWSGRLGLAEVG